MTNLRNGLKSRRLGSLFILIFGQIAASKDVPNWKHLETILQQLEFDFSFKVSENNFMPVDGKMGAKRKVQHARWGFLNWGTPSYHVIMLSSKLSIIDLQWKQPW